MRAGSFRGVNTITALERAQYVAMCVASIGNSNATVSGARCHIFGAAFLTCLEYMCVAKALRNIR